MGVIQEPVADFDIEEGILRRAVSRGAPRDGRPGPGRPPSVSGESEYLRTHGPLLSELRRALWTEHGVRLAVLYGSLARGDDDAGSDLDLLVSLAGDRSAVDFGLTVRLRRAGGRRVDVTRLERVEARAPLLLDRVLDEGRVLIDRDGEWERLCEDRAALRARALRAHRREMAGAARAIEELTA
jgi:predicted nucleotidyltransferase